MNIAKKRTRGLTTLRAVPAGDHWRIIAHTRSGRKYYCESATEPTPDEMYEAWMTKRNFFHLTR